MNQAEWTQKPPSPLPAIVVTCITMGVLAYLMLSVAGTTGSTGFIQFGAALATLAYLLTFVNIRFGLGILILCIGLSPEVSVAGFSNLRFEDFLVPALLAAWLLRSLREHEPFAANPVKAPIIAYLIIMTLSALFGAALGSVKPMTSILILGKNVAYFLILLIFLNNIRTYQEFKAFLIFALLVSVAASFISIGNMQTEVRGPVTERVHGPLGETANIFGGFLVLHICMFIGLFLYLPSVRGRLFSLVGAGLLFYVLMFTYSRTSYAALAASIGVYAVWKHRRLIILLLVVLVLFPLLAPDAVLGRAMSILGIFTGPGPESWEARVFSWEDNMERIYTRPILGGGPGSISFGDVDNEYFRVAIDLGLVGVLGLAWLLILLVVRANQIHDRIENPGFLKGFAAGYFIAITAILVHAFGATSFSAIRTMEAFMVLTAMMCVLTNRYDEWKEEDAQATAEAQSMHSGAAMGRRF